MYRRVRLSNGAAVLDALVRKSRPGERLSRDQLAKRAGLSRATVTAALDDLRKIERHRSRHGRVPIALFSNADFRPPAKGEREYISLNAAGGFFCAAEFSHRRITVGVADMFGRIASPNDWQTSRFPVEDDPTGAITKAADMIHSIIGDARVERVAGVGIAVAAPVDPFEATIVSVAGDDGGHREWVGLDPRAALRDSLGWDCGFTIANDANLAAWDEFLAARQAWPPKHGQGWPSEAPKLMNLLHVKWSSGVGAGLIVHARHHAGAAGLAGEIGHIRVPGVVKDDVPDTKCSRCGLYDCLENVINYRRIRLCLIERDGLPPSTIERMARHEIDEIPAAERHFSRFARYLGRTLAGPVAVLNPQAIAISGPMPLPGLAKIICAEVREGIAEQAAPAAAKATRSIYVTDSRWKSLGDEIGCLAVAAGAIRRARFFFAYDYAWQTLVPELAGRRVSPPPLPLPSQLVA
jgi:predicted NBD/HSP70 family sugar kinase